MLQNEVNALPRNVVYIYLRSFLLALMALSESTYRMGLEKMYAEADDIVEEAMGDLMTEVAAVNRNNNGGGAYAGYGTSRSRARVSFEQFAEWYNRSGLYHVSWIELLDATKWELQQPVDSGVPASIPCGVRLLDPSLPEHAVDTTMDKLQLTLMCFLLTLYGMSTSMSGDILRHSAQQGTNAVLQAFCEDDGSGDALDRSKPVSLKDFFDWFSESGYRNFAWLELVDLKHWPVEMNIRGVDG
ncbi:hypothetical protein ATCC90586_008646 [Pythium insidiosum]|nr:hypothetical protein ATCC90586_008646 [Pythium insidiosum]